MIDLAQQIKEEDIKRERAERLVCDALRTGRLCGDWSELWRLYWLVVARRDAALFEALWRAYFRD